MRILLILLTVLIPTVVMAQNTLPYMDGVPIIDGFMMSDEDVIVFDKPEGRVIDVTIWCTDKCPENRYIDNFYNNTMQKLGWVKTADRSFTNKTAAFHYNIIRDDIGNSVIIVFQSNG